MFSTNAMFLVGRALNSKTLYGFIKQLDKFMEEVFVGKYHL